MKEDWLHLIFFFYWSMNINHFRGDFLNLHLNVLNSPAWMFWRTPEEDFFFFSIWVFFQEHSRFTGQQGKGEGIYLTPLYHFHPLHRHLDISRAIAAESSPLHIAGSQTGTGNLWFPSASQSGDMELGGSEVWLSNVMFICKLELPLTESLLWVH